MSYDILITEGWACSVCGHSDRGHDFETNYTFNIRPMLNHAGITFQDLALLEGDLLISKLMELRRHLTNPTNRKDLLALSPPNGWGSLDGLVLVLERMHCAASAMKNPKMILDF